MKNIFLTKALVVILFAWCGFRPVIGCEIQSFLLEKDTCETVRKKGKEKTWLPDILKKGEFGIEVTRMFGPMDMHHLRETWLFLLEGGFLKTTLPYIGRMQSPNLSVSHRHALEIYAPVVGYKVEALRRGGYKVSFTARQVGEEFDIEIKVSRDAEATIYISSSIRSDIRYSGSLKMIPGKGL